MPARPAQNAQSAHAPDGTPDRIANRPTWLLSRAFARSSGLLAAAFEAHGNGLRGHHFRLLAALDQWGPSSQADLGRSTGIDRSDVTAALNDLEARGHVERRPDPAHKRRNSVTITPDGTRELLALDAVVAAVQEELLAPLTPAQRKQFLALLALLAKPAA